MQGISGENDACYIKSVFGQTAPSGGTAVFIDANHKLGTMTSSRRFKEDINPMNNASDALFALNPVTFHYKKDIDPTATSQFGLVAEDVEKVNRDLVAHDKDGKPYSVRYEQVNAMLLDEFLKEHKKGPGTASHDCRIEIEFGKLGGYREAASVRVEGRKNATADRVLCFGCRKQSLGASTHYCFTEHRTRTARLWRHPDRVSANTMFRYTRQQ